MQTKLRLPHIRFQRRFGGATLTTLGFLGVSLILYATAWWLRATDVAFNTVVLLIAGAILVVNGVLGVRYARHEPVLGYIFGGASVFTQILVLILLVMARQGTL